MGLPLPDEVLLGRPWGTERIAQIFDNDNRENFRSPTVYVRKEILPTWTLASEELPPQGAYVVVEGFEEPTPMIAQYLGHGLWSVDFQVASWCRLTDK